mmetsp:Transcript_11852/g.21694  ORF Transcript_11852/g.21694 Transcript_11852/m.21694 type:complete len:215 (+) Transcript_11852:948-1592(+)
MRVGRGDRGVVFGQPLRRLGLRLLTDSQPGPRRRHIRTLTVSIWGGTVRGIQPQPCGRTVPPPQLGKDFVLLLILGRFLGCSVCSVPSPAVAGNYGIDLPPGERMDLVSRCALASVVEVAQSSVVLKVLIERLPSLLMDLVVRQTQSRQGGVESQSFSHGDSPFVGTVVSPNIQMPQRCVLHQCARHVHNPFSKNRVVVKVNTEQCCITPKRIC